jgi:hypothetical protein
VSEIIGNYRNRRRIKAEDSGQGGQRESSGRAVGDGGGKRRWWRRRRWRRRRRRKEEGGEGGGGRRGRYLVILETHILKFMDLIIKSQRLG